MVQLTHHSVKSVRIWSYSGPHFSAFGLNTERYSVTRKKLDNQTHSNIQMFHVIAIFVVFRNVSEKKYKKNKNIETLQLLILQF